MNRTAILFLLIDIDRGSLEEGNPLETNLHRVRFGSTNVFSICISFCCEAVLSTLKILLICQMYCKLVTITNNYCNTKYNYFNN